MDVCLDCKDKVVKIYHFRRKVSDVQMSQQKAKGVKTKSQPKITEKRSKVVQNIYQIIENYTEKCSITAIRVDEKSNKLIIESSDKKREKTNEELYPEPSNSIIIKNEPLDQTDNIMFNEFGTEDDSEDYDDDDGGQHEAEDDSDTWRLSNFKKRKSTSPIKQPRPPPAKKSKIITPASKHSELINCSSLV
jgi:hypothetical protein